MADSHSITRRLFMRHGAAAGAALSTAAFAATAAQAARIELPADFMLAQLGADLDRLLGEWEPLHEEANRRDDLATEQAELEGVYPRTGYPFLKPQNLERFWQIRRDHAVDAAVDAEHDACSRIDAVCRQIRAIQPATLAGVKVWAKATKFDCLFGEDPFDATTDFSGWDWKEECLARLFLAIEGMS